MKFLLDQSSDNCQPGPLVDGQLLTPLTNYAIGPHRFAVDNGGFSRFSSAAFRSLLDKCQPHLSRCLFVAMPDVVGSYRRTLELFDIWDAILPANIPRALVAQDGAEDMSIPWVRISAIFIGGTTAWKMSQCAADIAKTGIAAMKHVHVGRVNTVKRYRHFEKLGCHTCDGSGVCRFSWMMKAISQGLQDDQPLFEGQQE